MDDNLWGWPERRELHRACAMLAKQHPATKEVSEALDILLNDLELYDDPHQGRGIWLFPDELPYADSLATALHSLSGAETSGDWGAAIIGHSFWPDIAASAATLLQLIEKNGQGASREVR